MSLRVCPTPGCPNLTSGGRCDECKHEASRRRSTSTERGYDRRWSATRARYLRAHPLCASCGAVAREVDHIDGLGPGGPLGHHWPNLRALCKPCHSKRTARDQPGGWNARRAR